MRRSFSLCLAGALLSATPAAAQWRYEDHHHHGYEAHWYANPERPEGVIQRWHQQFFGGPADPSWAGTWLKLLGEGATLDGVLGWMLATDEFYNLSGGTTAGYVKNAFTRLAGREPTAAEFSYWLNRAAYESRLDFAHDLIARYPPPGLVPPPGAAPAYEYRPPIWRYRH